MKAPLMSLSASSLALALCALAAVPAASEDYSQWPASTDLYLDTSPDGANVTGTVTGFPLLVRLDKAVFDFTKASAKGTDIRFSSKSGRHLPYQIDRWDSAGGKAAIWVKVDTVHGNDAEQSIRMHFGLPTAPDSSRPSAVFDSADGFVAVWHMGGPGGERPNAVPGGWPASPMGYDGNESVPGLIGLCDSLDNDTGSADFLTVGDGYESLAQGFSYSAWIYPTQASNWARLLDLGNGAGLDNVAIGRHDVSDELFFDVYNSNLKSASVNAAGAYAQNQWQLIDVAVTGTLARVYRNGALIRLDTLTQPISASRRAFNYVGKSNWYGDSYFRGRMDEIRLSRTARGADWIKLSHASQKADQDLVSFAKPITCQIRFAAPVDTVLEEGSILELAGAADCATAYSWSAVSGPAPRIFDPDVKVLQVRLPRIVGDAALVYRFTAQYPDSARSEEVKVMVKEAVPDPVFTLPASMSWDGKDSLMLSPVVSNLAAVRSSRDSVIRYAWTLEGAAADTAWRDGALLFMKLLETGKATARLCADNGGAVLCKETELDLTGTPTGLAGLSRAVTERRNAVPGRDVTGRLLPMASSFPSGSSGPKTPIFRRHR